MTEVSVGTLKGECCKSHSRCVNSGIPFLERMMKWTSFTQDKKGFQIEYMLTSQSFSKWDKVFLKSRCVFIWFSENSAIVNMDFCIGLATNTGLITKTLDCPCGFVLIQIRAREYAIRPYAILCARWRCQDFTVYKCLWPFRCLVQLSWAWCRIFVQRS